MSERLRGEDAWLHDALARFAPGPGVRLGPGHDCAALDVEGGTVVTTTDVLVDGVHFELEACGAARAARKALAVNLSDLAAAAAHPAGFVVGAVLPRPPSRALFDELMGGFAAAAEELACPCLGGDTNAADGPLVLAVTVLGRPGPAGVVSRAGARPGDELSVTGPLGGSRAGRHLTFRPRVAEALALARAGVPHAMMDLSDGLGRDLPRLCRLSGVGATVDLEAVPVHPDARAQEGRSRLDAALGDGEDFELLVAHAPLDAERRAGLRAEGVTLVRIGHVRAGEGVRVRAGDVERRLEPFGWDHLEGEAGGPGGGSRA
jgi:thiamine-monophosphate kinase